ncbi:MAG: rim15, signal transduction response regulator [Bogoriella megaspora]|nr:MAG: rim15, signal transduction response regulator [Bogoriella megaspora]
MSNTTDSQAMPPPPAVAKLKDEAVTSGEISRAGMERTISMDMREERDDLKRAAEQSLNVIMDLGLDGKIRWVSPSWQDVVGTPTASVFGVPIADLIVDNKTAFTDAIEAMKKDDSRSQILRFSLKMGPASIFPIRSEEEEPETPKPKDNDEEDKSTSEHGDAEPVIALEAQGIIVYDRTSGESSHTMWMIRPSVVREIKIDLPELLVESLGVGAEMLAHYLTTLAEVGANDPSHHPPPLPVLCRICERQITPWWFEKHSELCLQEHRAEMDVQMAHESLTEHRNAIVKVLDALDAQSRQSRPTSCDVQQPVTPPEYKGLPIGPASTPSSGRASPASPPSRSRDRSSSSLGHARARSFAVRRPLARIVELVLDLCDTALEINTPSVKDSRNDNGQELRTQSPQSENRISQILQWQCPSTSTLENEQGLSALCDDTENFSRSKVDAVVRHRRILEYSERIRVEFEVLVAECIDNAMRKAAQIAAGELSDSTDSSSESESMHGTEEDSARDSAHDLAFAVPPSLTPAMRSPAEEAFFAGSFEGQSSMAAALRNSSDPTLNVSSFRRSSSAAGSSRSSSPRGSKTPRSTTMSSIFQRGSIHAESDTGAESDAGSVISSQMSTSHRAGSPSSEQGGLRRAPSSRGADRKRRSLILPGSIMDSRQQSPARSGLSSSPLRVSKPRIPSGTESIPSPITSPALGTSEFSSPVMTAQHIHHHRRQSSATSSDVHRPVSPRLAATTHPQPRAIPVSIKDFEIIKPISKGAFGSVYLSKKKSTGEYYAIKVLKKADMVAKNQVTNVKAERAIMMWQGESDFVAKLYWTFSSKDYLYLVMEYLNGGDCASLIKVLGGLTEDWAKKYVAEVVLGVEHLHSRNIVHRDLKPDNLLIDCKGHLKLTDFGLSRMGLIGRQKRALNSKSQEPAPDLLKHGPFQRAMSMASSRSASFDLQGTHSPNNTPDLTPAFTGDMNQPSYFSLNREESNSRENSRRASGNRSDSGEVDALSAFFRRFSMAEEPSRNRSPIEEETSQPEDDASPGHLSLQQTNSHPLISSSTSSGTPPASSTTMPPPPMALFDPQDSTRRFVGTPDYLAPETINGFGQDELSDWWSLGCILFEMLYGYPPFHADTPDEVFQNILSRRIDWPTDEECEVSEEAKDMMNRLMCLNPSERLGANTKDEYASGGEEIRKHAWFADVNWDSVRDDQASFVPAPGNPEDTEYFDARGATLQNFADEFEDQVTSPGVTPGADYPDRPHDALSRVRNQVNNSLKRTLMPLHIPAHVRDGRSRRLSEPVAADDFGNFSFKNLPVLEKANKDVIQKLRAQAMQAQSKSSTTPSSATSPAVASPSPSLESSPMLPMPLKRTMSANKGHNRPLSPSVVSGANSSPSRQSQPSSPLLVSFGTGQGHERRKTSSGSSNLSQSNSQSLQPGSFFEVPRLSSNFKTTSTASSPIKMAKTPGPPTGASERSLIAQRHTSGSQTNPTSPRARSLTVGSQEGDQPRESLPSHHKRRSQVLNDSPSSSDNEEQQRAKALLRVQRRRQSSRRLSQITLADGGPTFRPLDVLICEDHPVSRLVMEKLLEKLRCRTISVTNGSEAVRYAMSDVKFDIIMMEFKLPQVNGADVARMIRDTKNANNHTPIVAVTGYLKELQGPHTFDGMVEKPPTTAKLTDILGKLCQWKPAPPGWSPAQASMSSYPIPSSLRHIETNSIKMGDSPTSSSSGYVQPTSSSYRGSSREDSISSSFFGETDSMTSNEVPVIISRQPTEEWRDRDIVRAFGGLGISEESMHLPPQPQVTSEPKSLKSNPSSDPASGVPSDIKPFALPHQGTTTSAPMAHLTTQLSAPPVMDHDSPTPPRSISPFQMSKKPSLATDAATSSAPTAPSKSPVKRPSAEKIAAKRRSFERERHESAESGDDEDEVLGDERVRARSPKRKTSPIMTTSIPAALRSTSSLQSATPRSSKLSTEMMRTNSQGSVISVEEISGSSVIKELEPTSEVEDSIIEDVVAEEREAEFPRPTPSPKSHIGGDASGQREGSEGSEGYMTLPAQRASPAPEELKRSPRTPENSAKEEHPPTITPPEIFPRQPGEAVKNVIEVDPDVTPRPTHNPSEDRDPDPTPRASGARSPTPGGR